MKIYFAGSIRGGGDVPFYLEIIKTLKDYGQVLTENIFVSDSGLSDEDIYLRDTTWLDSADIMVAEVTTKSTGVGYELGRVEGKKPILCLMRDTSEKRLSAMIYGSQKFVVRKYGRLEDVPGIFEEFLKMIEKPDTNPN